MYLYHYTHLKVTFLSWNHSTIPYIYGSEFTFSLTSAIERHSLSLTILAKSFSKSYTNASKWYSIDKNDRRQQHTLPERDSSDKKTRSVKHSVPPNAFIKVFKNIFEDNYGHFLVERVFVCGWLRRKWQGVLNFECAITPRVYSFVLMVVTLGNAN